MLPKSAKYVENMTMTGIEKLSLKHFVLINL